jgi:hypothetical protein
MKFQKYLSAALLAAAAGVGFTACDSADEVPYTPAGAVTNARVYFAESALTVNVDDDQTSIEVAIYRPDTVADQALTVQLVGSGATDLFTVAPTASFEAGEVKTTAEITFDVNALTPNQAYAYTVSIDEAQANAYGISALTLSISHSVWSAWSLFGVSDATPDHTGLGYYTFTQYYSGTENPVRVLSRSNPLDAKNLQFQFQWLLQEGLDTSDDASWETFMEAETYDGGENIVVPEQHFADNSNYGEVYVQDIYSYTGSASYAGTSTFDSESGLFTLYNVFYCSAGIFGYGEEYLQLEGYKDTNEYLLTLQSLGQVQINDIDYVIINATFNSNVDYVKYTVVDHAGLEEEVIQSIVDSIVDEDDDTYTTETLTESGNVPLTFSSAGDYTIVAVGYHVENDGSEVAKTSTSLEFHFDTVDPYSGWTMVTDKALFNEPFLSDVFGMDEMQLTVRVDRSDEFPGLYRINNPYATYPATSGLTVDTDNFYAIELEVIDADGHVVVNESDLGMTISGYGSVTFWSLAGYYLAKDYSTDEIPEEYFGTFDGKSFTFDKGDYNSQYDYYEGTLLFSMSNYQNGAYYTGLPFFALDLNTTANARAKAAAQRQGSHSALKFQGTSAKKALNGAKAAAPARFKAGKLKATKSRTARQGLNPRKGYVK